MIIYEYKNKQYSYEYTTHELLFEEPCTIQGLGVLYPVKVKDYKIFSSLASYILTNTKQHLYVYDDSEVLMESIRKTATDICKNKLDTKELENNIQLSIEIIRQLVSLTTNKQEIKIRRTEDNVYFYTDDSSVFVDKSNFETFRKVVLMMNPVVKEKLYFEDPITEKWYYKAKKAREKGNASNIGFEEMLIALSHHLEKEYEELKEFSLFRFEVDYYRMIQIKSYEANIIFMPHTTKPKIPNFVDSIIEKLYKKRQCRRRNRRL